MLRNRLDKPAKLLGCLLQQHITNQNHKTSRSFASPSTGHLLTDAFGRKHDYLRISLTERCNLRCQYCMPEEGVQLSPNDKLLTTNEIKRLAALFVNVLSVKKIRLTGGEPLVRKDIVQIVEHLNELKASGLQLITMTTNATVLKRNCSPLKNAGLDGVNISLDSLVPAKYEFITRRPNSFKSVMNGIMAALEQQFTLPVKINCVMMKGFNDDELIDFVEFTKDKPVDVRFIEYMPFDQNQWTNKKLLPYEQMLKTLRQHYGERFEKRLDSKPFNLTSKPYKVRDYQGQVGFITSMTNNFCSSCNRLRITADGNLKVCLFDQTEVSLRDELRKSADDSDLIQLVQTALLKKKAKHAVTSDNAAIKEPPELTHISNGKLNMVDVSEKKPSKRTARSEVKVELGKELFHLIRTNQLQKGDILTTAKIAGIQAAKRTADLIPLCHQLNLAKVDVQIELQDVDHSVRIVSTIHLTDRTGAEMESLVCSAICALTLYDMGKAVNKRIKVTDLRLIYKSGGKSGVFVNEENGGAANRPLECESV